MWRIWEGITQCAFSDFKASHLQATLAPASRLEGRIKLAGAVGMSSLTACVVIHKGNESLWWASQESDLLWVLLILFRTQWEALCCRVMWRLFLFQVLMGFELSLSHLHGAFTGLHQWEKRTRSSYHPYRDWRTMELNYRLIYKHRT